MLGIFFTPFLVGACRLLVQFPVLPLGTVVTDTQGRAALPLQVPNDAGLIGANLFSQWAVVDPRGELLGVAVLSDGLSLLFGR